MMTRDAFEQSLNDPLLFWRGRSKDEVESLLGKDVAAMVNYDQKNPHHCYDLFNHSLHTVDVLDDCASTYLRVAAFLHDIGKPQVAMQKQGRLVFYGHAAKSAEIADAILGQLEYEPEERELICFYIGHHDDFISWVLPDEKYNHSNPYLKPITRSNIIAHLQAHRGITEGLDMGASVWQELIKLCEADADSQAWYVYSNGKCVDSKAQKLCKLERIGLITQHLT